ncbi:MAG: hypothetical protein A3G49_00715 [Candidatus Sungbacteria bacterium RIFCSPLOWO2_12_FULL_41_11]|uniref:Uncharacterized protein n=1 Tax=Candidatus Sungbacteria bacterium RIFCSPLOWO2_12_FULL_41_11 TaxID=1802286 RepID=A0A1G2LNW5_9BACT|nr:MAG: hypothetical protein UV01_C0014G0001 [Parcubacteria group bacterium GW2011_GWA2_42_14]OGZ99115.1 MAG: hypothetical protein A3D41_04245 [Candidatus Sungbacteria bacterium RIFCSPHIGHO2_02_FULL_41_12b]OHA13318.1 MAG: hypothetical protein A3G49_00715 [Candidatus Sungbacteria bacterium RIFCSPLOWO2_12_FULL_41_11]
MIIYMNRFAFKNSSFIIVSSAFIAGLLIFGFNSFAASNSSISFKKDSNKLFVITFKDPEGIAAFSLKPATGKPAYGGEIGGCPNLRVLDNVGFFEDPADFIPEMIAIITDCSGNEEELSIPPPKEGVTKSSVKKAKEEVRAPSSKPDEKGIAGGGAGDRAKVATEKKNIAEARKAEIKYPVRELGNCKNESSCKIYCEDTAHIKACVAFAEKNKLISKEEVEKGKKFIAVLDSGGGPGGCKSEIECRTYCEDSAKADECLAFAEKHGFMSEKELATNKKMLALVKSGETPGGCKSKVQCEIYCSSTDNIEICIDFAEKNNVMPPEELALAKKMLPLMKSGETPGGCKSKGQCESYCETSEHMRECIAFAEKTGVMPPEELEEAKKVLPYIEKGETPGGCKSKVQCETYCDAEGNFEECVAFGEKVGFISKQEAEAIKKAGGKGPGGCRSKEQCETFCEDPAHIEECIDFGVKAGFVTEEDAQIMRKTGGRGPGDCKSKVDCEEYCKDASHNEECTDFAVKAGFITPAQEDLMQQLGCTSQEECEAICGLPENKEKCQTMMGMIGGGTGGGMGTGGFSGPGGCKSREECETYCREHFEECKNFATPSAGGATGGGFPGGGTTGGQFPGSGDTGGVFPGGPGGCQSQEECEKFCRVEPEQCRNFGISAPLMAPSEQSQDIKNQYEEQYRRPYEQQYQQQFQQEYQLPSSEQQQYQIPNQIPEGFQVDCKLFEIAPSCSYLGSPGTQAYDLCKNCFPNK